MLGFVFDLLRAHVVTVRQRRDRNTSRRDRNGRPRMPAIQRCRDGRNGSQSEVDELSHDLPHWHTAEGRARLERAVQIIGEIKRRPHVRIFMLMQKCQFEPPRPRDLIVF